MNKEFIASHEDWSQVISKSPTELNLEPLLESSQYGGEKNDACIAEYRMRLSQDVNRLPYPLPRPLHFDRHESWRNLTRLESIRDISHDFVGLIKPRLFLRTREEIRNPQSVDSIWAGRANAPTDHTAS